MKKILFIILSLALFASCDRKIDKFAASANGVDFSKFVSVGNSMTAGYADGALSLTGQTYSIPNIMATQFKSVGGGEFKQPLLGTTDGVGFQPVPGGIYCYTKMVLKLGADKDCWGNPTGTVSMKPGFVSNPDQATLLGQLFAPPTVTGPYNNMGVPGATLMTLFYPGYGSAFGNPYFTRFATSPATTMLTDAVVQQPTFFYLWIGNNDALASALAGTDMMMTPADTFAKYYPMAVGALLASGRTPKGVLGTIPYVTSLPFFTTISKQLPWNGVPLDATLAAQLNGLYALQGHPEIVWKAGLNPFVYKKEDGTLAQMAEGDEFLLTLPTDSIKCRGMGIVDTTKHPLPYIYPIPGKYILTKSEQANINQRIFEYNQVIKLVASSQKLALADMNAYLPQFESGITFDGISMSTTFVTGGMFSTDGIHLNPRGNSVAANFFIQAINSKYGCTIPQADVTKFPGLLFPNKP
ncbi:MAG: hypothetical protein WCK34_03045 [Bacteroidota bacterium]